MKKPLFCGVAFFVAVISLADADGAVRWLTISGAPA
jgi:hypothetical protein